MFEVQNIAANDGYLITIVGILMVFLGLFAIFLVVTLMNNIFNRREKAAETVMMVETQHEEAIETEDQKPKEIPQEHIAAIFAAIELYRRLHFDIPTGGIQIRENRQSHNSWKMGQMYGQRTRG